MTMIELTDERAAVLKAKASALGLTLEAWLEQLAAEPTPLAPGRHTPHIAELICESMKDVPAEIGAAMPKDGASQHDHYIYGWPKREP